jgi:hypothetical protein
MARPMPGEREPVLVGEGGLPYTPEPCRDPLVAWMDLMEVVEALCPRWPERPPSIGRIFLL